MGKADYKKYSSIKENDIQDRLRHKGIFCISNKWFKWAKQYLNRSERRKIKRIGDNYYEY